MASSINPNNIDTAYPVAGQDNDSQGFRDNFTNIKTNFEYSQEEIEDLQNKVILKAGLTGTTLNNDMGGALISAAKLQDTRETWVNLGLQSGNVEVDVSAGGFQTLQTSGDVSLDFTGIAASGDYVKWRMLIDVANIAHQVTLPVSVSVGVDNITGWEGTSPNTIDYGTVGKRMYEFSTYDGGSSVIIVPLIQ